LIEEEVGRRWQGLIKTEPEKLKQVGRNTRGSVRRVKEVKVRQQIVWGDRRVMKAEVEMRFRGVPLTEKFCSQLGDSALIRSDCAIGEKCLL
jgi:hypothetical protein